MSDVVSIEVQNPKILERFQRIYVCYGIIRCIELLKAGQAFERSKIVDFIVVYIQCNESVEDAERLKMDDFIFGKAKLSNGSEF